MTAAELRGAAARLVAADSTLATDPLRLRRLLEAETAAGTATDLGTILDAALTFAAFPVCMCRGCKSFRNGGRRHA